MLSTRWQLLGVFGEPGLDTSDAVLTGHTRRHQAGTVLAVLMGPVQVGTFKEPSPTFDGTA